MWTKCRLSIGVSLIGSNENEVVDALINLIGIIGLKDFRWIEYELLRSTIIVGNEGLYSIAVVGYLLTNWGTDHP